MKTLIALVSLLALCACSTTVTQTTLPNGSVVTVTSKTSDPVAIKAAMDTANLLAPYIAELASQKGPAK